MGKDKIPPQNLEAERAVLGGILTDPDSVDEALDILRPTHFYNKRHEVIFEAISNLFSEGLPTDRLSVGNELDRMGKLEAAGGKTYLLELIDGSISSTHTNYYAEIIAGKATLRELIRICSDTSFECFQENKKPLEILQKVEHEVFSLAEKRMKSDFVHISQVAPGVKKFIENVHDRDQTTDEVRTSFEKLDEMTTGFKAADYVVLAGATSSGKTAYALSVALNVAMKYNRSVGIFSLEMSAEQLVMRLLSSSARVDAQKIRKGTLNKTELSMIDQGIKKLVKSPIYIDETASQTILTIRSKCRKLARKTKLDLVIIDYLQLVNPHTRSNSRERDIAEISHGIKALARELSCPVIALSQLSRQVERRPGKHPKPRLSDLRESGSIEQDADLVMFVYRPEYYNIPQVELPDGRSINSDGIAEIIIAKQRNGPVGSFFMRFDKNFTYFDNLDLSTVSEYIGGSDMEDDDDFTFDAYGGA